MTTNATNHHAHNPQRNDAPSLAATDVGIVMGTETKSSKVDCPIRKPQVSFVLRAHL